MTPEDSRLGAQNFEPSLGCLIRPHLDELATQLALDAGLEQPEREVFLASTEALLLRILHAKLSRLLLLELNAARVTGRLCGIDSGQRWDQFLEISSRPSFWSGLATHYPTLLSRVDSIIRNRCSYCLGLARHWSSDRHHLDGWNGAPFGELRDLRFGAGDSHSGGSTVAIINADGGSVIYKPRSLAVDIALRGFVSGLARTRLGLTIRVPRALDLGDHGWAEFIVHRYASDSSELRCFYRGIGHWLAIMRLLGGSDLHSENLIAHGGAPVIVDCETLFTPPHRLSESGFGQAQDRAAELLAGTVLNVGLLPGRGIGLGWRGIDVSATGMLPNQQPVVAQPDILDAGTDKARLGTSLRRVAAAQNHPSPDPTLTEHWPDVLDGFDELNAELARRDDAGDLQRLLRLFRGCSIRIVPRATEVYAEIGRMLWHPVSLHDPGPARRRAFELLREMASKVPAAPAVSEVIDAEIDDLLEGDIPYFSARVQSGNIEGPRRTIWRPLVDPLPGMLRRWRQTDWNVDRNIIRASLVGAYLNDGGIPEMGSTLPSKVTRRDLDARRRHQAALIMRLLMSNAIEGADGTITWIAPVLGPVGWVVQPLPPDLYSGLSGIALAVAAYLHETEAGRADPVPGLEQIHARLLRTLCLFDDVLDRLLEPGQKIKHRPPASGSYIGLGSQIWAYIQLWRLGFGHEGGIERALALAEFIPRASEEEKNPDLLSGIAGAVAALLFLHAATGDDRTVAMASDLGDRLCDLAIHGESGAYWVQELWPEGMGGFAHGVTGMGWALMKLARQTGKARHRQVAQAAFAFEDGLFDENEGNWLDMRKLAGAPKTVAAWCHGAVGIGLAHLDLDPAMKVASTPGIIRRAIDATHRIGLGWSHGMCHGDTGAWELIDRVARIDGVSVSLDPEQVVARIVASLEQYGPSCGIAQNAFMPGLMAGTSGIAYQLLRMHPDSRLPSVLLLEDKPASTSGHRPV